MYFFRFLIKNEVKTIYIKTDFSECFSKKKSFSKEIFQTAFQILDCDLIYLFFVKLTRFFLNNGISKFELT